MRDSACRWFIVKKLKYFEVMLNIFEFSRAWENVESWLVYANKLERHNKTKLVPTVKDF